MGAALGQGLGLTANQGHGDIALFSPVPVQRQGMSQGLEPAAEDIIGEQGFAQLQYGVADPEKQVGMTPPEPVITLEIAAMQPADGWSGQLFFQPLLQGRVSVHPCVVPAPFFARPLRNKPVTQPVNGGQQLPARLFSSTDTGGGQPDRKPVRRARISSSAGPGHPVSPDRARTRSSSLIFSCLIRSYRRRAAGVKYR